MRLSDIISLLGGAALFLFGMSLMGEGLTGAAGSRLEPLLRRLSGTPLRGVLLGCGVTALIQSSSAVSVTVVGFVNAGLMTLPQAISVIQGALVGTSVTGWLVALGSLPGGGWLSLLSASSLSALVAVVGIALRMASKKHAGDVLLGFAVLMFALQSMSASVSPLRENAAFLRLLTAFSHPLPGVLVGAACAAMLQSASAAVGLLQAVSLTGALRLDAAYPLLLGIAVGSSAPVLLSALGATTDGRRAALSYLLIEALGALLFGALYYALDPALGALRMDAFSLALVNTLFRAATALVLAPFPKRLARLLSRLIKEPSPARSNII